VKSNSIKNKILQINREVSLEENIELFNNEEDNHKDTNDNLCNKGMMINKELIINGNDNKVITESNQKTNDVIIKINKEKEEKLNNNIINNY